MLRQLAIGSLISILFSTPAMANNKFAADVTGARTAPHLAVRKACPKATKGIPARGYRAVVAQCARERNKPSNLFVPDKNIGAPLVTQGSATR
ncbi:MAG: hypothetical protein ACRC62_18185 [Microcoleus sp.]